MSFRDTVPPSQSFQAMLSELVDFKRSVEDGDYTPIQVDVPFQLGNLIIDTPENEQTGKIQLVLTNATTGESVVVTEI